MRKLVLGLDKIEDKAVVEAFVSLTEDSEKEILGGFRGRFYEIMVTPGSFVRPHFLGYTPKDVLQTSLKSTSGAACTWVWNYRSFDKTSLSFTVTGTAGDTITVRAFIGKYEE